jgi:hypothetical protein
MWKPRLQFRQDNEIEIYRADLLNCEDLPALSTQIPRKD